MTITLICKNCKEEFQIKTWRLKDGKRGKFCSIQCNNLFHTGENSLFYGRRLKGENNPNWQGGKPNCIDCGKQLSIHHGKRCQHCNLKFRCGENHPLFGKKLPWLLGDKHHNWKGGISSNEKKERTKFRLSLQKLIFERDRYKCQICESKKDLQVDHIQSWAEFKELRFNPENCRTLCAKCHYKITFGKEMPKHVKGWGHNLLKGGY
jgi:hypothetical protein